MTTPGALVLVVEDERPLRHFIVASLSAQGYRTLEAGTLNEALGLLTSHNPELVLLDLGLPDGEGLTWLARIREWSLTPVIVVSARGREADKIAALDAGADDYLTKPFGVGELLARLRVALRHARTRASGATPAVVDVGPLRIDLAGRLAYRDGAELRLTPIEWRLLALMAMHVGKVLTHRQILKEVWGPTQVEHTHYVRVYMNELRKKIEPEPNRPRYLVTETGVGYRLREPEQA